MFLWLLLSCWAAVRGTPSPAPSPSPPLPPSFNASFEGGNVLAQWVGVSTIEYRGRIVCGPASSKCSPYDNWVYFSVNNLSTTHPTTLHNVGSGHWASPLWFSYHNFEDAAGFAWGADWQRVNQSDGRTSTYMFAQRLAFFAFSIPYVGRQRDRLFSDLLHAQVNKHNPRVSATSNVDVFTLATSEAGNAVMAINISSNASTKKQQRRCLIWFQARQHAWESASSWVADGVARFVGSGSQAAQALLEVADVVVVPIMDIDNVMVGGSGKDQEPVDFNRDWCELGNIAYNKTGAFCQHWKAIRAVTRTIDTAMTSGRYSDLIFVDSHSPGNPEEPAQVWTECQDGPMGISHASWQRIQSYKWLLKTNSGACGRLSYKYWCAEVGPAYGNKNSGLHSNEISFMYFYYLKYAALMNYPSGRSMSFSHETSAATVAEAHCYAAAMCEAWVALLLPPTPVVPPATVPTCSANSSCRVLPLPSFSNSTTPGSSMTWLMI
eukprot:gnl/MRDRNA2_/MRDRNA2_90309_c0_seq1.p1 gnl/MRDRNA2_/MRDRNA2_90309_c0~~gnl/MRDRNA2_/MRDRNA2_90309_c0_seq1.p1  ORF type:complete len:493 (+),score=60.93 gnl/MRDRNA2_/MRDRNA2_90309_c0_seq1:68-1546(+)